MLKFEKFQNNKKTKEKEDEIFYDIRDKNIQNDSKSSDKKH